MGVSRGRRAPAATPPADDTGWLRLAILLFAVAFGTNVFTPIILIYRQRLHLSPTAITGIFATYAAGLIVSLLFAGYVADRVGRRRVALPFTLLAAVASVLFLPAASSEALLFVARFVQGVATGAVFSVGTAWLVESSGLRRVDVAARRASVAMNAGFAVGPLTAGLLAQFAPAPTVLPFAVHVVILAVAAVVCRPVPETLRSRGSGRLLRVGLPPGGAGVFWLVLAPLAFCVFVFPSTGISTLPIFVAPASGAVAFVGVIAGLTLGSAAVASRLAWLLGSRSGPVGLCLGAAGFAVGVAVEQTRWWGLLVPGWVLLGAASGLCMTAGLTVTQLLATDETRGSVNAAFYTLAYLGFGVPVVVTAVAGEALTVPLAALSAAMLAVAGWLAAAGPRYASRPEAVAVTEAGVASQHERREELL